MSLLADRAYPGSAAAPPTRTGATRRIWVLLWVWTAGWALVHVPGGGYSWHYFGTAARLLVGSGPSTGLHVYAAHPELQMGPLAMLAAIPIRAVNPALSYVVAPAVLTVTGPLLLRVLVRARERLGRPITPTLLLTSGLLFLPVWTEVTTHYAHLDDVLALGFGVGALLAAQRGAGWTTGLMLAASVDSKPWALSFAVLLLLLPAGARSRAAVVAAAGIAAAWLPFLLGDPGTASLTHFTIDNADDSGLRALGVQDASTPAWDRPAQVLLGAVAAVAALQRGRWPVILLMAVAARILLDPETYPYYTSGLVLAAVVADLLTGARRLPLWTGACTSWYAVNEVLVGHVSPSWLGVLRLLVCAALLLAATLTPADPDADPEAGNAGGREDEPSSSARSLLADRDAAVPV